MMNETLRIGDTQQCLEASQAAVGAPVLGQFDRGAGQVAVLLQLGFEQLEKRECIGRAAGKSGDDATAGKRRTLRALPFMTVLPMLTWPSPPMATLPLRRTETMVVPRNCSMLICPAGVPRFAVFLPRARVSLVVYLGQMLEVKVRIHLGRRDVGVTQQFLHAAQVVARLEQVGGEGMPEQVWIHLGVDTLPAWPSGLPGPEPNEG